MKSKEMLSEALLEGWLHMTSTIWNERLVTAMTYNESLVCNILYKYRNIPEKAVTLEKLDQNIQDTISIHTSSIANNRADINKNTSDIASLTSKDVAENKNVLIRLECREDGLYVVGTDI